MSQIKLMAKAPLFNEEINHTQKTLTKIYLENI